MDVEEGAMEPVQDAEARAGARAVTRLRKIGRPVCSPEELYGPGPGSDDLDEPEGA